MVMFPEMDSSVGEDFAQGINRRIAANAVINSMIESADDEAKIAARAAQEMNANFSARWGVPSSEAPHQPITVQEILARKAILASQI